jgi:hypothetical protein
LKVIVTDISSSEVIVYTIDKDNLEWNEEKDESELIEDLLSQYHKLGNISWMQLEDDFKIEFKSI